MDLPKREVQLQGAKLAWYCARTQPKHEHIAAGALRSRLNLEVFNPRLRIERNTRRGIVKVVEPLFPCYIFVRCQASVDWDAVRHVNGISSLVHFGQHVPSVPDEAVDELKQYFDLEGAIGVEDVLKPGAQVIVSDGPFLGSRGLVIRTLPGRQRVQILLEFLGRETVAEVERGSVRTEDCNLAELVPDLAQTRGLRAAVC